MKNPIKTLTILLVTFLFSNVANATVYSVSFLTTSPFTATWKDAGGATIGAPTLTINDDLTVTAGTWSVATGLKLKTLTLNGGSFTIATGGSLTSNNSGGATYPTILVKATAAVSSVARLGAITVQPGGTLTMGSTFTASSVAMTGGNLDVSNRTLTGAITASASGTISGSGTFPNITINGGTLTLGSDIKSGVLTLSGGNIDLVSYKFLSSGDNTVSSNATIKSSGTGLFFNNSQKTTIGNNVTLTIDNAEYITDDLTFNSSANDIETINGGVFSFDNSGQSGTNGSNGASASRHINGTVRVYYDGNSSSDTRIIPLGDGTAYAPVTILFSVNDINNNALSNISIDYGTHFIELSYTGSGSSNKNINFSSLPGGVSGTEFWSVNTSTTNPGVKLTFRLNTSLLTSPSSSSVNTHVELANNTLANNSSQWGMVAATPSGSGVERPVITDAFVSPKGLITFGSNNSGTTFVLPLPVSLIDFSAKANANNIEVKWSTASEKDNASFVVEKSIEGLVWSSIATVMGAKNSNVVNNYGVVDYKAVAGFQYYRLKQTDLDGTVTYSKAIAVNFSKASTLNVNLFPNPAKDALNITTENNATGEVNIQILNSMGETVYNKVVEAGLVQSIDIASFIPGVYYVSVIAEGESKIIRLLKN
jgi:hypothetical protein